MTTTEQPIQKPTPEQALAYMSAALSEYAETLRPSVRGPFTMEINVAIAAVRDALPKPVPR